jgi:hypothetical protein
MNSKFIANSKNSEQQSLTFSLLRVVIYSIRVSCDFYTNMIFFQKKCKALYALTSEYTRMYTVQ